MTSVSGWDTATLSFEVSVPRRVFTGTLPRSERGRYVSENSDSSEPPVALVIAGRCRPTIFRDRVVSENFDTTDEGDRVYSVEFEIEHHLLRGDLTTKPYLVRTSDQEDDGYATSFGDRLASDEPWTVRVDPPDEDGGFLQPIIEPFGRSPFPGDNHLHYLHFEDPSTPKLFLNANHGQLVNILKHDGTWGADARLRDVLFDYIEQSVWQELLLRTANDVDRETGETRHPWQEEVIDLFAPDLFDDEDDEEDVAMKLAEHANSEEDLDVLAREFDAVIQKRVNHPDQALSLLQEGLDG